MGFNDDHPLCVRLQDFLALSVLKDDPAYRDAKLVAGDTLPERYEAYVRFYREALKHWALYGMQYQLGSSASNSASSSYVALRRKSIFPSL